MAQASTRWYASGVQLPNRLSQTTLGDVLGALHRAATTGVLELRELPLSSRRSHRVHLEKGLVTAVDTDAKVPPLGEILVQEGLLGEPSRRRLLGRLAAGDPRASGQILIAEGLAASPLVDRALSAQLLHKLDALFRIGDALIAFHIARSAATPSRPLGPNAFLHGRPRARDEAETEPPSRVGSKGPHDFPPPASARRRAVVSATSEDALSALGLCEGASAEEIRRAFRRRAAELHPDRVGPIDAAERARRAAELARLTAAYHRLVA